MTATPGRVWHSGAKVNLFLRVLGRRADGFHDIESVFHPIGLADRMTFCPGRGFSLTVSVVSPGAPGPPSDETNLVTRAARALAELAGVEPAATVELAKAIPTGAGLGGGSSNAAAALLGLRELWGLSVGDDDLAVLGARLGSDVPFFLYGRSALVAGRGETVTPLPAPTALWFVLGISRVPLAVADVYRAWDRSGTTHAEETVAVASGLAAGDPEALARTVHNDLEEPAFGLRPELRAQKEALLGAGALAAIMSGSGAALCGLARDRTHAEEIARRVAGSFDRVEVVGSRSPAVQAAGS
ncbi:MAG: 4-(cytidine 5'-diphospho)-2-C-methyl-D-erythritol kinase [Actinomycetota bacterium]